MSVCAVCLDELVDGLPCPKDHDDHTQPQADARPQAAIAPQMPAKVWAPVLAALAVAVVGGLVWGIIGSITHFEVGFVATLIGVMAGRAVVWGAGGRRNPMLQSAAVATALFGILIGKYVMFMHAFKTVAARHDAVLAAQIPWLSGATVRLFFEEINHVVSGFDLLWVVLAAMAAWRVARDGHLPHRRGLIR